MNLMIRKLLVMSLLMSTIGAIGLSEASGAKLIGNSSKETNVEALQKASQNMTDASYKDLLQQSLGQFNDDLNQSSFILDEYIRKNISRRDAMVASTSLYVLTSHSLDSINQTQPPKKYATYFNFTIHALENLKDYLWNMGKFYETSKTDYAITARINFNDSMYYYEKGREGISS
jgi:flagellar hook-basal body complex protein FliE